MKINHKLLELFLRYIYSPNKNILSNNLRVLMYHDIPPNLEQNFKKQLIDLKKNWNFITPTQFENFINKKIELNGNNLLLTFDDGFISSKNIAEKILSDLGIHAIFFVISDFIEINDINSCREFISENILINTNKDHLPRHLKNMQWEDIKFLKNKGHTIGAHTKSHKKLSQITNENSLKQEICNNADIISHETGFLVDHFAYSFGDISSFNQNAYKMAINKFKYIYSGVRGNNINIDLSDIIFRDEINMDYSGLLIDGFLKGIVDFKYKQDSKIFQKWKKNIFNNK